MLPRERNDALFKFSIEPQKLEQFPCADVRANRLMQAVSALRAVQRLHCGITCVERSASSRKIPSRFSSFPPYIDGSIDILSLLPRVQQATRVAADACKFLIVRMLLLGRKAGAPKKEFAGFAHVEIIARELDIHPLQRYRSHNHDSRGMALRIF